MANYHYRISLGLEDTGYPASNATDRADFENNYKSTAVKVTSIEFLELTFSTDLSYADFKSKVVDWADVNYVTTRHAYELSLISGSPL